MTDRLDEGLRQAFNADAEGALKGWEFTPAMQRQVLERIAALENGGVAATRRPDRFRPLTRPWVWAAVGAAACLMLLRVDMDGFGGGKSASSPAAQEGVAADSAAQPQESKTFMGPITPPDTLPLLGRKAPQVAAAPKAAAEQGEPEPTALGDTELTMATDDSGADRRGALRDPTGSTPGDLSVGVTGRQPGDAPGGAAKRAAISEAPRQIELTMPAVASAAFSPAPPAPAPGPRLMTTAEAPKVALAAAPAAGEARELSLTGLRAVGSDEAALWEIPLTGITDQSQLAVAEDGRSAVSAGNAVFIVGPTGEVQRNLILEAPVRSLSWSRDGRLAVVQDGGVAVYRGEQLQYHLLDLPGAEVRFAPDGALAVLDENRALTLFDREGNRLMRVTAGGAGRALAFSPDGTVVETGAEAFDRSGRLLWRAPVDPIGALPLAESSRLALWDAHTLVVVNAVDGRPLWQAEWHGETDLGLAANSPAGRYLAVSAPGPEGGLLWLLDADGEQLLTEALPAAPSQMAFAGEHRLLLLIGQAIQSREIAP